MWIWIWINLLNCFVTLHRRNGFYTVQTVFSITLHQTLYLNLPITGNFVQILDVQNFQKLILNGL